VASPATIVVPLLTNQPLNSLAPALTAPHGGVEIALKGARGPPVFA
jgi:hypothetical protein